ncbi:isopenicillin N synthase family dioxygenase [Bradyrhizobium cenepequi]
MGRDAVATIDINPFIHGDAATRARVAKSFGAAFENNGFAVIVGHGISNDLIESTYSAAKLFFAQTLDEKIRYTVPEKAKSRGYLPPGIESVAKTLSGETPPDLCEALVFGALHRELRGQPGKPNFWPVEPKELRPLISRYCQAMEELTGYLARMSALALDLSEHYFDAAYSDPSLTLRFVNYPDEETPPQPGQMRYGEHHDYGGLTVLRQDSAPGGLQIWDDGGWHDVTPIPESFVINVGDLMSRWTNGRWQSTLHRVINPPRNLTGSTQRLSMVAFVGPNEKAEIACLPTCSDAAHPPQYEPVVAGDYIKSKIAASMDLTLAR